MTRDTGCGLTCVWRTLTGSKQKTRWVSISEWRGFVGWTLGESQVEVCMFPYCYRSFRDSERGLLWHQWLVKFLLDPKRYIFFYPVGCVPRWTCLVSGWVLTLNPLWVTPGVRPSVVSTSPFQWRYAVRRLSWMFASYPSLLPSILLPCRGQVIPKVRGTLKRLNVFGSTLCWIRLVVHHPFQRFLGVSLVSSLCKTMVTSAVFLLRNFVFTYLYTKGRTTSVNPGLVLHLFRLFCV